MLACLQLFDCNKCTFTQKQVTDTRICRSADSAVQMQKQAGHQHKNIVTYQVHRLFARKSCKQRNDRATGKQLKPSAILCDEMCITTEESSDVGNYASQTNC